MNTENFFDAMALIDERYKLEAMQGASYRSNADETVKEDGMHFPTHKSYRKIIALAAAIVLLLALGIAASAGGWFGVQGLELGKVGTRSAISLQGLSDSPEYKACAEWKEYDDKLRENDSYFEGFDYIEAQELQKTYGAYNCYTREQADTLQSIADKYSLRLLSGATVPEGEKAYYEAAGVGRLLSTEGDYYNEFSGGYVYDDGSFKFEGALHGEQDYAIPYSFIRSVKGTMTTIYTTVTDIDSFEDWEYTAADGTELNLSNSESGSFIIYDSGIAFVVISIGHESWADRNGDGVRDGIGDEAVSFTIANDELERIADCFCLSALSDSELGMDKPFTVYERERIDPSELIELGEDIDLSAVGRDDMYYVKLAIEQSISPYVGNIEIVDFDLTRLKGRTMGWIEFSGTPKQALDWACVSVNGKNVYCRSLNLIDPDHCGEWSMGTPFDMQPCHRLPIWGEGDIYYSFSNREKLQSIAGASLYVTETDETYELSTAQELETLGEMLSLGDIAYANRCTSWNPLYLTFRDGSRAIAYCNGDGSNYVNMYGFAQSYGLGMSIYELFDVPLEAAGYTRNGDIVTTCSVDSSDLFEDCWLEMDYEAGGRLIEKRQHSLFRGEEHSSRNKYEYDSEGHIICLKGYGPDETLLSVYTNEYNDLGQLIHSESLEGDLLAAWCYYFYDEQGRLIREERNDFDSPPDWKGGWVYYEYDSDGTCHMTSGFDMP